MAADEAHDDRTKSFVALAPGTTVSHYKIISKIGSGGMGEVYLAEDTKLHRRVALKFLPAGCCQDGDLRRRFIREAEAAAKLNHPNIVTIYEVDDFKGRPFIAMEHVEGPTLKDLCRSGTVEIERVIQLALQILDGLKTAHDSGVIHRDIKPSNIMVDSSGRPKIVDFGLAAVIGSEQLTRTHSTMGTIQYMSPEQVRGEKVGAPSDLFSFGVVLYQMLTNRLPFAGDNEAAVVYAITSDAPPPIRDQRSDIPSELEDFVTKLLQKELRQRYQTADEAIADLERFFEAAGMRTPSARAVFMRRPRGRRISATLATVAVVAVLILTWWKLDFSPSPDAMAAENRIAVMYFDNLTDSSTSDRLGEIITNLLITDLSESQHIEVMSSQRLYDILKQLGREGQKKIDRNGASEIAKKAHCQSMLLGAILQTEPNLVITSHLIDVESGTTMASQRIEGGSGEAVFALVDSLTVEVRKDLALPGGLDRSITEVTTSSPDAYRYYLEGLEFENRYLMAEAAERFQEAIKVDSTFAMALCRLGWVNRGRGGLDWLEAAMKYRSKVTQRERWHIESRYDLTLGRLADAQVALENIVEVCPDDKETLYDLGVVYGELGRIDSGIVCLEHVIELDPFWEEAFNRLAYHYDRQGRYEEAIWAINQNIRLAPDDPNPYDTRGELLALRAQLPQAKQSFQKALEIHPGFTYSVSRMGEILALERKYDSALVFFKKQIRGASNYQRGHGRANMCAMPILQGQLKKALEQFCLAEEQDMLDGLDALNKTVWQAGIFAELTADTNSIVARWDSVLARFGREYPDWVPADEYLWTIASLTDIGAQKHAEEILRIWETREGFVSDHRHLAARARVEFGKGNYEHAAGLLDSALTYSAMRPGWTYFLYSYWLGRAHFAGGNYARAIQIFDDLSHLYSSGRYSFPIESVKLYYYLGRAYQADDQNQKAIEQYDEFLLFWNSADAELHLIDDARQRLADLKSST